MPIDRVSIQDAVQIKQASAESVAFELAMKIATKEGKDDEQKKRDYWLTLYYQCLQATKGFASLEQVLKV